MIKEIITNKSDYTGIAGKDVKTSTIYSTFENPEKIRNAIHTDYQGAASFATEKMSRDNYSNAEIRETKEVVSQRDRSSGPQKFQTRGGRDAVGDIKTHENMLLKEREEDRENINLNIPQAIPSKEIIGIKTQFRYDNDIEDTIVMDRLQPDLVINQHNKNPYSIFGTVKK